MRPGFTPTPRRNTVDSGTSVAATMKNAAEEKSPGTSIGSSARPRGRLQLDSRAVPCDPRAAGAQQALRVVARRRRLDDGRRAAGVQRGEQHARLHLGRGDGQLVRDPGQRVAARSSSGGQPSSLATSAPISRSGVAMRSIGRRRIDASPSSMNGPTAGRRGGPAKGASASRSCATSMAPAGSSQAAQPDAVHDELAAPARRRGRRAPARQPSVASVSALAPNPRTRTGPSQTHRPAARGGTPTCRRSPRSRRGRRRQARRASASCAHSPASGVAIAP